MSGIRPTPVSRTSAPHQSRTQEGCPEGGELAPTEAPKSITQLPPQEVPEAAYGRGDELIRDERGVRLARPQEISD